MRVLSRAILAYNDDHLTDRVLVRLIGLFEFLDVCRIDVRPELISVFVNNFLAAFVPHVASTNLQSVVRKLSLLVEKGSVLPWVLLNRAGLVLVCVLLSRFQIIKSELPETVDSDSDDTGKYLNEAESSVAKIFSLIQDRLAEIVSGDCGGDDAGFYGWQFVALLAMSIEAEKKRILVAELRERILSVVQSGNPEAIANLDIFLHVIGLNSSQLAS